MVLVIIHKILSEEYISARTIFEFVSLVMLKHDQTGKKWLEFERKPEVCIAWYDLEFFDEKKDTYCSKFLLF